MMPSSNRTWLAAAAALVCFAPAGCMTHDMGGDWRMGAATDHNIAQHAVREVDAPNMEGVEGGAGGRSGAPVKVLRDEGAKALRTEGTGG